MIEKGRISAVQMAVMMYPVVVATGDLLLPAITAKAAGRDMWLSPMWSSLIGFFIVYIVFRLNKLYPKESMIQYSLRIVGTIPGKMIGFLCLFFWLHIDGIITRQYAEFVVGNFLVRTPMFVVLGSLALVCAFAVRGGLEVVARAAQFFVPILILLWVLIIAMLIPDLKPNLMFPIMEKGMLPSIKGALTPHTFFTNFILISFLLPFLTDRVNGMKWGMISVFGIMVTMTVLNIGVLFLFGEIAASFAFPVMEATKYINIADFLEHLEVLVMVIWVAGAFIKVSVFYYVLVLGAAQWLNLSDYRPLVFPFGFLLVLIGVWSASSTEELSGFLRTIVPFYQDTIQLAIPLLLFLIAVIRKGVPGRKGVSG